MRPPHLGRLLAVAGAALVLAACATTVTGKPVSVYDDPFKVGGLQASDGPTGLRPDAEPPTRKVTDSNGGKDDEIAGQSVSDIETFWESVYSDTFKGQFTPVKGLYSWDANDYDGSFCGDTTDGLINAAFCEDDNTIGWDRGVLLPSLREANGDMAITMVLAHEYGHAIQKMARLNKKGTPALVAEQQADCFAGVYLRWVAEGNSPIHPQHRRRAEQPAGRDDLVPRSPAHRGRLLRHRRRTRFGFRADLGVPVRVHRRAVFVRGDRCPGDRPAPGDLPVELPADQTGELPVTEESARSIVEALNILFAPKQPPQLTFDAASAAKCPDARPSPPVSYCPATNTIAVDLPKLQKIGTAIEGNGERAAAGRQHRLLGADVALHDGAGARARRAGPRQRRGRAAHRLPDRGGHREDVQGSQHARRQHRLADRRRHRRGGLGLLTNGLAAGDVNGEAVPAGFSRIDAFRIGVMGDENRCIKRFP